MTGGHLCCLNPSSKTAPRGQHGTWSVCNPKSSHSPKPWPCFMDLDGIYDTWHVIVYCYLSNDVISNDQFYGHIANFSDSQSRSKVRSTTIHWWKSYSILWSSFILSTKTDTPDSFSTSNIGRTTQSRAHQYYGNVIRSDTVACVQCRA